MRIACCCCAALAALVWSASNCSAQVSYERGADGRTYRVTKNYVPRTVPTTEVRKREETVYRPEVTTTYQTYQQTYLTPVTEYRWVSRMRGRWNPFQEPCWTHDIEPVTRWESRPATVQVPVTTTNWVAERRTVETPVTTYRTVTEERTTRVAVSGPPPASAPPEKRVQVASRPSATAIGGQRLDEPVRWGESDERYRR